jgi:hypothetical protein
LSVNKSVVGNLWKYLKPNIYDYKIVNIILKDILKKCVNNIDNILFNLNNSIIFF